MSSSKNRRKAAKRLLSLSGGRNKSTAWMNDIEGLVRAKKYHGQTFANIEYSYDANQRLAWRKFWSSPTVSAQTSYGYDDAGNLLSIDYPTSPDVSFTYNENNQQLTMTTAGLGTITNTYTDAGNLWTEGGLWPSDTVTNTYHASVSHLRTGLTLAQPALTWAQSYAYDAADRLETVTSQAGTFTYTYLGPGTLWTNLALPNTSAITNAFDTAGRLTRTALRTSANALLNSHDYLYNTAGQRQRQTLTDSTYTAYGFDDDAQLTNSLGYLQNGTPVASEQLGFGYDGGWNMTGRAVNGSPTSYTVNDLNEVTSVGGTPCTYDQNGNRLTYGQGSGTTTYEYDDENRLTRVTTRNGSPLRSDFTYDGLDRLRLRAEYTWYYNQWSLASTTRYIYDGKRVIQERNENNTPLVSYTRGKDLSGTLEGAGGIGGLLARSHGYSGGNWSTHNFYHADGNGNITCMVDSGQSLVASYKYDPYGRTISSSGSLAAANVYRFSSKEFHANSGFYYYLYRFYDPNTQKWLNRDPLQENGGINLYAFVLNDPVRKWDPLGMTCPSGYRYEGTFWGFANSRTLTATVTGTKSWTEYQNGPPPATCADPPSKSRHCEQPIIANQDYIVTTELQYDVCQKGYGTAVETLFIFTGQSRTSGPVPTGQPYNLRPNGPIKCGDWEDATGPIVAATP